MGVLVVSISVINIYSLPLRASDKLGLFAATMSPMLNLVIFDTTKQPLYNHIGLNTSC